jgi:hypothetical protein
MSDTPFPLPTSFQLVERIRRGPGEFELYVRNTPTTFLVRAVGGIGPALVRDGIARAAAFGEARPEGWEYIADTTRVRVANPLNVFVLRRIRHLPNLTSYSVIAPSPAVRRAIRWTSWIVSPDRVVSSMSELESGRLARE